jgi:hypothetical protein
MVASGLGGPVDDDFIVRGRRPALGEVERVQPSDVDPIAAICAALGTADGVVGLVEELGVALDLAGGAVDAVDAADDVNDAGPDLLAGAADLGRGLGPKRRCLGWRWQRDG